MSSKDKMDLFCPFVSERQVKIKLLDAGRDGFYFTVKSDQELVFVSRFFETKVQVLAAIEVFKLNAGKRGSYARKMSPDNKVYFVYKCSEGNHIGQSLHYDNASSMEANIGLLNCLLKHAETVDLTITG